MIRFKDKIDPYAPCYCGSGKKYRFCCQNRHFDISAVSSLTVADKQVEKAKQCHARGHALMSEHKYEEAIIQFKRSIELNPNVPNPVNNLALCYFVMGNADEALKVQREYLAKDFFLPAFGLANLSMFLYFQDEEAAALNALYIAAAQNTISRDASLKICEMFARLHRYQDLYDFVFFCPGLDEPDFAFFAGGAAANVGDEVRAMEYLSRVPDNDPRQVLAKTYLTHLEDGTRPESIRGDWPMLTPWDFYMENYLKDKTLSNPVLSRLWFVDFVAVCLFDPVFGQDKTILELLKNNRHPEAAGLLRKLATGSIGSDELRQYAGLCMLDRGDIKSGDVLDVQLKGERHQVKELTIDLDPNHVLCELPEEIAGDYTDTVLASHAENPDWERIAGRYKEILNRCPAFFPAEFNYATALLNFRDDTEEAEKIARRLIRDYPEYLFAHAMLLNILTEKNRYEEGMQLIRSVKIPEKMHPDTWNEWLVAQFRFHLAQGKMEEAKSFLNVLENMPDKDSRLGELKTRYETVCSLHQILFEPDKLPSSRHRRKNGLRLRRRK